MQRTFQRKYPKNLAVTAYSKKIKELEGKKKLLEKQKEGKKRMRQVGSVEVPSEVFMEILKTNKD